MPRVTRVTGPSVAAPNLQQSQQSINAPSGAFGGQIAAGQAQAGQALFSFGEQQGQRLARQREREDAATAASASGPLRVEQAQLFEDMKADPGTLSDFDQRLLGESDKRIEDFILKNEMTEGAAAKLREKMEPSRANLGINAIKWKSQEFVRKVKGAYDTEIGSIVRTAGVDMDNLESYYAQAEAVDDEYARVGVFAKDDKSGFKRRNDVDAMISKEVANTLISQNPATLLEVLQTDKLRGLTAKEKRTLESQAVSAVKNIGERAAVTRLAALFGRNQELSERHAKNELTYKEVDELQRSDEVDSRMAAMLKKDLTTPEDVEFEEAVEEKVLRELVDREFRERTGLPAKTTQADKDAKTNANEDPDVLQKLEAERGLYSRFLDFAIERKTKRGKTTFSAKNAATQLSDLLDFQNDVTYAAQNKYITRSRAMTFTNKILPILRANIESKHFQGDPDGVLGTGFFSAPEDTYTQGFNQVLAHLEKSPAGNSLDNQVRGLQVVMQLVESRGIDKIQDPAEKQKAMETLGQAAIDVINSDNFPQFDHLENKPNGVVPKPVTAADILRSDPSEVNRDFFDAKFGQGSSAKILGE